MTTIRGTQRVSASPVSKADTVKVTRLAVGDRGLKVTVDAKTNALKISGTARGIETRNPGNPHETNEYLKTEQFGGGMGFSFDLHRMPKFDTSRGFTEKNKWYFAHVVSVGTKAGQTPVQVARALAAEVNGRDGYAAKVKVGSDGSALVQLSRT